MYESGLAFATGTKIKKEDMSSLPLKQNGQPTLIKPSSCNLLNTGRSQHMHKGGALYS